MGFDPRLSDPDALREMYWGERMSSTEMSEALDCSRQHVVNQLKKYDIEVRSKGAKSDGDYELLKDADYLYQRYHGDHLTIEEISNEVGCSDWLVSKWFRRHGIETYSRGFRPGSQHPNWKGGKPDYYGPSWYQARRDALDRDDHRCQRCGLSEPEAKERYTNGLNVHHIRPAVEFKDGGEFDHEAANELSNLITLCHGCHKKLEGLPIDTRAMVEA